MKAKITLAFVLSLCSAATMFSDSHAFVFANGAFNGPNSLNSITPFNVSKLAFGQGYFVPPGANFFAVAPVTGQIWEVTGVPSLNQFAINILDAIAGSTLATLPMTSPVYSLVLDRGGVHAYVLLEDARVLKIDVATRTVVQTLNNVLPSPPQPSYGLAVSSDGLKLVVLNNGLQGSVVNQIVVIDTKSMTIQAAFSPGHAISVLISGNTLVVCTSIDLLYYDLTTLKQINSASVPPNAWLIGLNPDGSKIYLGTPFSSNQIQTLNILDFSTGTVLASRSFGIDGLRPIVVAPNGSELVMLGNPIELLDANTLATTNTITGPPANSPPLSAFADSDTLLILNSASAVMAVDLGLAQVTDTFPLALPELSAVASPQGGRIFAGGRGNMVAIDTLQEGATNYFPVNLPPYGGISFYPYAMVGDRLYGLPGAAYNLTTNTETVLPGANTGTCGNCQVRYAPGAAAPNGRTYWAPFVSAVGVTKVKSQGVVVYSTATNTIAGQITFPTSQITPVAFSPDSSTAYVGVNDTIMVYNTATLQNTATYTTPAMVRALAVSLDGSALFASNGAYIYVIDAASGAQKDTFVLPDSVWSVYGVNMAISSNGRTLVLTDNNKNLVDEVDTKSGVVTQVAVPYPPTSVVVVP
jgi:WD40 repeat protein